MNNYYAVVCKCGHVGKNNYILITFPIIASNKKEAARIARDIPRCKHHHKDCIREVTEVSRDAYLEIINKNNNDPYLKCKCIQEQRNVDLGARIIPEKKTNIREKEELIHCVYYGKTKIKHPKKFFRYNSLQMLALDY